MQVLRIGMLDHACTLGLHVMITEYGYDLL